MDHCDKFGYQEEMNRLDKEVKDLKQSHEIIFRSLLKYFKECKDKSKGEKNG